ncbi:hypothetical protein HGA13_16150 [Nocardia speluncae]|uniref:Secreted protein n=1 Tax=Nocardia speluncae TaxID=419477 RepID=A0A846XGW8_9NOCA|nr:hypothetical protein [Nocardia speluncae]NKY34595.1 hypothetical protein [Nocardia speluncae]
MRKALHPLVLGAITAATLLTAAAPAWGQDYESNFPDAHHTISPECAGTVHTEAARTPLPTNVEGVGVAVTFTADRPDPSCSVTVNVTWRNIDSGAAGQEEVTVSSMPDPGGRFPTDHGYGRVLIDSGPGNVSVTSDKNPGELTVPVQPRA